MSTGSLIYEVWGPAKMCDSRLIIDETAQAGDEIFLRANYHDYASNSSLDSQYSVVKIVERTAEFVMEEAEGEGVAAFGTSKSYGTPEVSEAPEVTEESGANEGIETSEVFEIIEDSEAPETTETSKSSFSLNDNTANLLSAGELEGESSVEIESNESSSKWWKNKMYWAIAGGIILIVLGFAATHYFRGRK